VGADEHPGILAGLRRRNLLEHEDGLIEPVLLDELRAPGQQVILVRPGRVFRPERGDRKDGEQEAQCAGIRTGPDYASFATSRT